MTYCISYKTTLIALFLPSGQTFDNLSFGFKNLRCPIREPQIKTLKTVKFNFRNSRKRRDLCTFEIKLREWSQMRDLEEILNKLDLLIGRYLGDEFSLRLWRK